MTVGELIERLSALDSNLKVIMPGEVDDWCEVHGAFIDLFSLREGRAQLADERQKDTVQFVRLFGPDDEGEFEGG